MNYHQLVQITNDIREKMSMINDWAMSSVQRNTAVQVVKECIRKIGPARIEANILKNKWNEISQNLNGMIKVKRTCPVAFVVPT